MSKSAFGVDHGETIEKFSLSGFKTSVRAAVDTGKQTAGGVVGGYKGVGGVSGARNINASARTALSSMPAPTGAPVAGLAPPSKLRSAQKYGSTLKDALKQGYTKNKNARAAGLEPRGYKKTRDLVKPAVSRASLRAMPAPTGSPVTGIAPPKRYS